MKRARTSASKPAVAQSRDPSAEIVRLCDELRERFGAVKGRALSKEAVTVGGKIVAFITQGRLVVKLPPDRIGALLASGEATPMRMGSRSMKEWVSVTPGTDARWTQLAEESARFVTSAAGKKRR